MKKAREGDFVLFIDMDGYVCFYSNDGKIYWTLNDGGWEAFYGDEIVCETGEITYPTEDNFDDAWDCAKVIDASKGVK